MKKKEEAEDLAYTHGLLPLGVMRGVCWIKMRFILTVTGIVMLVLVTWIATDAQRDQREANVSVPHAVWTTTTTEDVVVVTKIEIDSRVRSDLNYGQKKP